ncbi:TetR family transcriptional regulator [Occultella glacieicola]|uniref:TetR family transcriptional regulator n=1 Tax=Occultella glacieicola TaxID=2518684 RepID=A0ABY2E9I3_9MICO|nr:TetR family transcriptional regulator [Occultella glacieicola]TDE98724.1 TetR family transcriptional regulator [Occultella glacieicola]
MPRTNPQRRDALADAAIAITALAGVGGVTHRAVDRAAQVPIGTTANYFPSRDELLSAAARRVADVHLAESAAATAAGAAGAAKQGGDVSGHLTELLTVSLVEAATTQRARYLAIYELQLEAQRRPALAAALARLSEAAEAQTQAMHLALRDAGAPPGAVPLLITLYGGALFMLVTGPGPVDTAAVRRLVEAMVAGARSTG